MLSEIHKTLTAQTFKLDFIAFGCEFILSKDEGPRSSYTTALNAFSRFLGSESIDINDITRSQLVAFQEWADQQGVVYTFRVFVISMWMNFSILDIWILLWLDDPGPL